MWKEKVRKVIDEILALYGIYSAEIREMILANYVHPEQNRYNKLVFRSVNDLAKVPVKYITFDMLVGVVDAREDFNKPFHRLLPEIPEDISHKLFRKLVKVRSSVLKQLPEKFINDEFVEIAMQCPLFTPHDLPHRYQSYDIWEEYLASIGIEMTDEMRGWVPHSLKNFDNVIVNNANCCMRTIRYFCVRRISDVKFMHAYCDPELVKIGVYFRPALFHAIPIKFLTHELCMYAFVNGAGIFSIPEKFRSYEIYIEAFNCHAPLKLMHVPVGFRDFKMCQAALKDDFSNFSSVPDSLKTLPMCLTAVSNGSRIDHVPPEFRTYEIYRTACTKYALRYSEIPLDFRTQELVNILEKNYIIATPDDIFNENSCLEFIKSFPDRISQVPEKFKTPSFYESHKIHEETRRST